MTHEVDATEASLALEAIEHRRREVLAEINVPAWYWPLLAGGWVGLGAISEFGPAWVSTAATVAFGAVHASLARRALSGRHGSPRVSVRRDLVTRRIPLIVVGFLIAMVAVTIAIALGLDADGARHPAFDAGLAVGVLVLAAGPGLMSLVRRRAQHLLT
jgi:hypothetical protein